MRRLVVKLALAVIAMPVGAALSSFGVYAAQTMFEGHFGNFIIAEAMLMMIGGTAPLLVIGAWALLWRRHIRWTRRRRNLTWGLAIGGLLLSAVLGGLLEAGPYGLENVILPIFLLYLTATPVVAVRLWRCGDEEERQRLRDWMAAPTQRCPYCEGILTGRRAPLCPYCGGDLSGYTLAGGPA